MHFLFPGCENDQNRTSRAECQYSVALQTLPSGIRPLTKVVNDYGR